MGYGYHSKDMLVLPQDLQDFAWSAPMRDLAATIGLSDVGLKKLLKAHGVITPPQGHWNRAYAGKPVPKCPTVPPRRPGETGRIRVDQRFAQVLTAVEAIPSEGPFASAAVPEDLDELYAQELRAIGWVGVPRTLDPSHPGLRSVLLKEERRRQKFAASGWRWDAPRFDGPVDRRRLRIFNALFLALARRGHGGALDDRDEELSATAVIGSTAVDIELDVTAFPSVDRGATARDRSDLPSGTPLRLSLEAVGREKAKVWEDDASGRLESKLADIAASAIVAGEELFRRRVKDAEEREEQFRRWREKQRLEEIARRNAERLAHLRESGELLRQAEDLRALIARVRDAVGAGDAEVDRKRLEEWERWALAEADRLDPILSGQIKTHLVAEE
jgi:hypothetical protein